MKDKGGRRKAERGDAASARCGPWLERAGHVWIALLLMAAAGCREEIDTFYGRRKGIPGSSSVNGTAVLAEMFEHDGHRVFSWNSLSPRLHERADVIVWFPDDFAPPSADVRDWLENWLLDEPNRTLILVGRDFDAAPWYWKKILPGAPPGQVTELQQRLSEARTDFGMERRAVPASEDCDWFTIDGKAQRRDVRTLDGKAEWLEGVDPAKVEIELHSRLVPPDEAEVLLRSKDDVLVSRQQWEDSRVIVVANGSFLLNAMLVNHEHRKLAGQLIKEVGPPQKTVVFLESWPGGPPIRDEDPFPGLPTGMEIFHIWPTDWILLHTAVVGILFCLARFPVFGRPREIRQDSPSDFGKHIDALGELLERSGDTAYAYSRLVHYRQVASQVGSVDVDKR
ncbi:MAG: hypothetical protein HUU20_12175 [Pirellulales bacterium]|nr:hypothetical protein [Pirellulales bacterium]